MFWPLTKGLPTVSAPTCQQQGHLLDGASTSLSRKEGHLLQDSSHQGGQLSQPEHGGPEQGRAGSSSGASTGPLAQNPRPTRWVWALLPKPTQEAHPAPTEWQRVRA